MKPHGTYKLLYRSRGPQSVSVGSFAVPGPAGPAGAESLLERLEGGEGRSLRIRRVFTHPREIYRLELELPELGYQRTTLLDRDALEELLEADAVRQAVETAGLGQ
jgi:hypothetical protein